MALPDTCGTVAPTGLKIVGTIELLLALPWLMPLARLAIYLGFPNRVNHPIYWLLPIINSLFVAYTVTEAWHWWALRQQALDQRSPS